MWAAYGGEKHTIDDKTKRDSIRESKKARELLDEMEGGETCLQGSSSKKPMSEEEPILADTIKDLRAENQELREALIAAKNQLDELGVDPGSWATGGYTPDLVRAGHAIVSAGWILKDVLEDTARKPVRGKPVKSLDEVRSEDFEHPPEPDL
jgi:hypothetical protein